MSGEAAAPDAAPGASLPPAGEVQVSPAGEATVPPAAWVGPAAIDAGVVTAEVLRAGAGAVVTFEGRVRDHDGGRDVVALSYCAHPDADAVLRAVVDEAAGMPGVRAAAARHRTGGLAIGDLVFFVAVAAEHRREAFAACAWLVDETKGRLPVWKHQYFADGTDEWVNCA